MDSFPDRSKSTHRAANASFIMVSIQKLNQGGYSTIIPDEKESFGLKPSSQQNCTCLVGDSEPRPTIDSSVEVIRNCGEHYMLHAK